MTTRATRDKWTEEIEEIEEAEVDVGVIEEAVEVEDAVTSNVMALVQETWKEISTKNQLAAAQSQDIEDQEMNVVQDLTLKVHQAETIST